MWKNFAPACRLLQRAVGKESLQEVIDVHGTIPYLDMHYKSAHLCVDHEKNKGIRKRSENIFLLDTFEFWLN